MAAVAVVAAAVLVSVQVSRLADAANDARDQRQADRRTVVAGAQLARSGAPLVSDTLLGATAFEQSVTVPRLLALEAQGKLPLARVRAVDRLDARANLQFAFEAAASRRDDAPAELVRVRGAEVTASGDGCVVVTPRQRAAWLVFRPGPATTSARIDGVDALHMHVVVTARGARSASREVKLLAYGPFRMRFAAAHTHVEVGIGASTATLCGATVDPAVTAVTSR